MSVIVAVQPLHDAHARILAIWLFAFLSCCGTSLCGVYIAFGSPSLSHFITFQNLELGLAIGMVTTLTVGTCGCFARRRISPAIVIGAGILLSLLAVWLWYLAWAAAMRSV